LPVFSAPAKEHDFKKDNQLFNSLRPKEERMQTILYVIVSLVISFVYFQTLDFLLMDAQGLDYFYMFR